MRKLLWSMAAAAALCVSSPALAGGSEGGGGARLFLGNDASPGAASVSERGVRVTRGAAPVQEMLAGAGGKAAAAPRDVRVVVVHHYHAKRRTLRTQGFYSGYPTGSRRFTQGFYSGPVDKGRFD